ncbi:MAG: [protein-PII] uridylyltransferase [Candidatus Hydrogenedentes bacterium]|nr:[protein-PII] uridylyltransferase [Candidatus Hydrogenedentota bacterium]
MSKTFLELVTLARANDPSFRDEPTRRCVEAARAYATEQWKRARAIHQESASGQPVLRALSESADEIIQGAVAFALCQTEENQSMLGTVAICALGGYGRNELSPRSDLDICFLYEGEMSQDMERFNAFLVPFLWDLGFKVGYVTHQVEEAYKLAQNDLEVMTSYAQARLILGSPRVLSQLMLRLTKWRRATGVEKLAAIRTRENPATLAEEFRDLYAPEPDVKQGVGGLRDVHLAQWLTLYVFGVIALDDLEKLGHLNNDEFLDFVEARDFIWRIRNELHFHAGSAQDRLSFELQKHVAQAFGYGKGDQPSIDRFMRDYYAAARRLRIFLERVVHLCEHDTPAVPARSDDSGDNGIEVIQGAIYAGHRDANWFQESPARLMEVFWASVRRKHPVSAETLQRIREQLHLAGPTFRGSELVRRFFVAICSRPVQAGDALRQMAECGLLGAYLPEFQAIHGIVRYEDFHSYPVDEHTLRAVNALSSIPEMQGRVGELLQRVLEHLQDPHVLVLGILFHDIGKASGETHVEEGVLLCNQICDRMGINEDDRGHIVNLVQHHMLMTDVAMYRDTDNLDTVQGFASLMRSPEQLGRLLLLSYCDLSAVGPNVWTDWKGALLCKLYLKTERILLGRPVHLDETYWELPKAEEVKNKTRKELQPLVETHLRAFGEQYFISFPADEIASHIELLAEARDSGLSVRCFPRPETAMSEVVVCTRDRIGLFSKIAGSFAAQLIDVSSASVFSSPDGLVVDCFMVTDAANGRPITEAQFNGAVGILKSVLLEGADVQHYVDRSRQRLFATRKNRSVTPTRISFDNEASRRDTVIDLETGDRTGLLYDVTRCLATHGVELYSARIVTDARRARDAFYVRLHNGKIADTAIQEQVRTALVQILQPEQWAEL